MERKQQIIAMSLWEGYDLETLQFATWLVTTRKFAITNIDGTCQTVLIPFLDMLNHSNDSNARVRVLSEAREYILECARTIEARDQVTITYGEGNETSSELLVKYGFHLEH